MPDEQSLSEMDEYYARTRRSLFRPTTLRGKIGCGVLLVLWFVLLLLPCAMFWLATGHTFTIAHGGDVPEAEQHPRFEIRLIMETDNRGLQLFSSHVVRNGDNLLCVQADVNYILWQSSEDTPAVVYCDCYERSDTESMWLFVGTTNSTCGQ